MDKTWREFEKMVARIEEMLSPKGAVIKSPDKIADKVTGRLREVDASIRYKIGSVPILITIECRERVAPQDITWLEQIRSKKESVGANQTIVVSKEGFTDPAKKYAQQHGLVLRQLSQVTDEFILKCLQGVEIFLCEVNFEVVAYRHALYPAENLLLMGSPKAPPLVIDNGEPLIFKADGKRISLQSILDTCFKKIPNQTLDAQAMGKTDAVIEAKFPPNEMKVKTTEGERFLQGLHFQINVIKSEKKLPSLQPVRYTDENGEIIESFSETGDYAAGVHLNIKFKWDN